MFDPGKILVLAPHTDDGELGCGGTIAKFCEGKKSVHYAAFSTCGKSLSAGMSADTLTNECNDGIQKLGVNKKNLILFDFEVREFTSMRQAILEELVKLNKEIAPDLVLIPSSTDIHQDHHVIHQEALRAFKHCSILGYELPWNQQLTRTNFFVSLNEQQLQKKIEAIQIYKSQSHRNYTQPDFIRSLAKVRGVQCGSEWAEAFEVQRLVN